MHKQHKQQAQGGEQRLPQLAQLILNRIARARLDKRTLFQQQQISPYFNPTYTRTGWIGQPPVLDRHEVVTIDGDVVTLRQATP